MVERMCCVVPFFMMLYHSEDVVFFFFFSSRRRHTRFDCDWSSDVCSSDLLNDKAAFEATPIFVDGTLYLSTPFNRIIALDPSTGGERWTYDPQVDRSHEY